METNLAALFGVEIRRRVFEECFPRLLQCIATLTEEQLWYRPNQISNSVGNLALHLHGNLRQWVCSTLGEQKDVRERQLEFDERGPISATTLNQMLLELEQELRSILMDVPADALLKEYGVQGYRETGMAILIHITEHFSYHVGQATYIVKMLSGNETNYYSDHDLDAHG
ncbi:MAG: DUF1572 domain-containing protein [Saprospiraceae bacterium]|nr:DUF1572 domain-containing protein [Saprospiraceae bacterium]